MSAGRRDAGGLRLGRTDLRWRRQTAPANLGLPGGAELFAQGLQRGGPAAGHRDVPAVLGKCGASLRRRADVTQSRQPQGGGIEGGLVRPGDQSEAG